MSYLPFLPLVVFAFEEAQRCIDFRRADILIFIQHVPERVEHFAGFFDSRLVAGQG
jgi:hypothetical protein